MRYINPRYLLTYLLTYLLVECISCCCVFCSDNHFDVPDRTFHSLQRCYQLVTMQSVTDTKELIPEFYYLPEFLENHEGECLGVCE